MDQVSTRVDAEKLVNVAIQAARDFGASYADVRFAEHQREDLGIVTGVLGSSEMAIDSGLGIRLIIDGAWGFASTPGLDESSVKACAKRAAEIARAGARTGVRAVKLDSSPAVQDTWCTPILRDPFKVSIEERLALLLACDEEMRKDPRITRTRCSMSFSRERQLFANTDGSLIRQELIRTGAGIQCVAVQDGEAQVRSYPMSFGGDYRSGGYELVLALDLLAHAPRVRDEAIALTTAPQCPSESTDLILMPSQLFLQIHESVGHPNELDRVFGWELDFAGGSFVRPEMRGEFQYGSELVNLIADNTVPGGLATAGYDDDGVAARRWPVVQKGIYRDGFTTRDTAPLVGCSSNGCNRAEGWSHVPITRIPNLSLMPGDSSLDEIIAATDSGIIMDMNKSWSIDQLRLNFQFGCEAAWEVKNGKRGRLLRNPTYQDMTPRFWRSMDMIAGHSEWELTGVANCGKGQPGQTAEMSHGSAPARFRGVRVGVR